MCSLHLCRHQNSRSGGCSFFQAACRPLRPHFNLSTNHALESMKTGVKGSSTLFTYVLVLRPCRREVFLFTVLTVLPTSRVTDLNFVGLLTFPNQARNKDNLVQGRAGLYTASRGNGGSGRPCATHELQAQRYKTEARPVRYFPSFRRADQ